MAGYAALQSTYSEPWSSWYRRSSSGLQQTMNKLPFHLRRFASSCSSPLINSTIFSCDSETQSLASTRLSQPDINSALQTRIPRISACTDGDHDDDILSETEVSYDSEISLELPEAIRSESLTQILHAFNQFRRCNTGSAQDTTTHSDNNQLPASSGTNVQQNGSGNQLRANKGKRKRDGEGDGDGEDEQPSNKPRSDVESVEETTLLWACPFYKWKPLRYPNCRPKILREINRVKQHLRLDHSIPIHCVICSMEFQNKKKLDAHLREQGCARQELKQWEGFITEEQSKKLKKRSDRKKTQFEQWYDIFAILFPAGPRPESPYMEGKSSSELLEFRAFIAQEWSALLNKLTQERLPIELRQLEAPIQQCFNSLVEEILGHLLDQFESSRTNSGSSQSRSNDADTVGIMGPTPIGPTFQEFDGMDDYFRFVSTGIGQIFEGYNEGGETPDVDTQMLLNHT
ncbi:hypothetical protein PT974_12558 [Cladobotryum mycophilum]|uniref:C2H2-type domain-containing protein n=1 Tax=Cladobotryum mycophilum TaxID=491253 RepID=A0ABR0S8A0_9HYPO